MDARLESGGDSTVASRRNSKLKYELTYLVSLSLEIRLAGYIRSHISVATADVQSHALNVLDFHQIRVRTSQWPVEVLGIF